MCTTMWMDHVYQFAPLALSYSLTWWRAKSAVRIVLLAKILVPIALPVSASFGTIICALWIVQPITMQIAATNASPVTVTVIAWQILSLTTYRLTPKTISSSLKSSLTEPSILLRLNSYSSFKSKLPKKQSNLTNLPSPSILPQSTLSLLWIAHHSITWHSVSVSSLAPS